MSWKKTCLKTCNFSNKASGKEFISSKSQLPASKICKSLLSIDLNPIKNLAFSRLFWSLSFLLTYYIQDRRQRKTGICVDE